MTRKPLMWWAGVALLILTAAVALHMAIDLTVNLPAVLDRAKAEVMK